MTTEEMRGVTERIKKARKGMQEVSEGMEIATEWI
jgi:hypothetical protein